MIRIAYVLIVLGALAGQIFGFDLMPFREGDLWGHADPFGSIVYPPGYKPAGVFRNGIARVQTKDGYGDIAMNGREFSLPIWNPPAIFRTAWRYVPSIRVSAISICGGIDHSVELCGGVAV